jgi:hypothetical protein
VKGVAADRSAASTAAGVGVVAVAGIVIVTVEVALTSTPGRRLQGPFAEDCWTRWGLLLVERFVSRSCAPCWVVPSAAANAVSVKEEPAGVT